MTPGMIARAVGDADLAQAVVGSIADGLGESAVDPDRDRGDYFASATRAVTKDVESYPTAGLLRALIANEAECTNDEIRTCLEFIYSHMVSKFQGYLAEFLAMGVCGALLCQWRQEGHLPPEVKVAWGADIQQRRQEGTGWAQGADGLFISQLNERLVIAGVIEVKSHRRRAAAQASRHVERLRHGIRIGGRDWSPRDVHIGMWSAERRVWSTRPVLAEASLQPFRVLVRPRLARREEAPGMWMGAFTVTLPYAQQALAQAAYSMAVWYLEELGRQVFTDTPSPWPNMDPEESGINAVKEALYYILLRQGLPPRAERITSRLYNVLGFGFEAAQNHRNMIWHDRGPLDDLETAIEQAWEHYRRCEMDQALAAIATARAMAVGPAQAQRLQWLEGMVHYFRAEFEEAARTLPQPTGPPDYNWAKEKLTKARALIRLDQLDAARAEIEDVEAENLRILFVSISLQVCKGLAAIKSGELDDARIYLEGALEALRAEMAEIGRRVAEALGLYRADGLDQAAVSATAMDMLPGFVTLESDAHVEEILTLANRVFPPYRLLVTLDPDLTPLHTNERLGLKLAAWLTETDDG